MGGKRFWEQKYHHSMSLFKDNTKGYIAMAIETLKIVANLWSLYPHQINTTSWKMNGINHFFGEDWGHASTCTITESSYFWPLYRQMYRIRVQAELFLCIYDLNSKQGSIIVYLEQRNDDGWLVVYPIHSAHYDAFSGKHMFANIGQLHFCCMRWFLRKITPKNTIMFMWNFILVADVEKRLRSNNKLRHLFVLKR